MGDEGYGREGGGGACGGREAGKGSLARQVAEEGEERKRKAGRAPRLRKEYTGSRVWRRGALPRALETEERAVVLVVGSPDVESTIRANE